MAVVSIGERDNGSRIDVQVGDTIELTLPETATTGFGWDVNEHGESLTVQSSEVVPPEGLRAGAQGARRIVVRADQPGRGRLSLSLRRAWEPPDKNEGTFAVDIDVT
jgi:predicted secreted protein